MSRKAIRSRKTLDKDSQKAKAVGDGDSHCNGPKTGSNMELRVIACQDSRKRRILTVVSPRQGSIDCGGVKWDEKYLS